MGKYLADVQELEEMLARANPKVKENVVIETPDTMGQEYLYHIAQDIRPRLFPNISKRSGPTEDNTLPRVCMGANLMNCWLGYTTGGKIASTEHVNNIAGKVDTTVSGESIYKGGYYIHQVPMRGCLRPSGELIYETLYTEEMWLVTYNELTASFPTDVIGLLIPTSVTYVPRSGKKPVEITTLILKVNRGKVMHFSAMNKNYQPSTGVPKVLREGFYQFNISIQQGIKNLTVISEEEFNEKKLKTAGLLNY